MNFVTCRVWSLSLLFFLSNLFFIGIPVNAMGPMGKQQLSANQMQDIEKELMEANRAIEEYVAGLPPKEQEEFNRVVEEVSQMFENMSEEEFSKFLGEMFTEEPLPMPMELEPSKPVEQQEIVEQTVLSSEQKRKAETVIVVLDDIIKQTELFFVQTQSSPEIFNAIKRWGTKGVIANWQPGADWKDLKSDIEKLVQQLYKSQDQDLVTKQYNYLFDIIADESLLNNLIQLQTNLNNSIPRIELGEFGIEKISAKTKTLIKKILNYYTESLYLLAIPQSLNAVFEKYEPTAKKSREAEEAAEKKAVEASKRTRTPASATEAGTSEEYGAGYSGYSGYGDYGYYPSYGDYGYSPSYGGGYGDYGYSPSYGGEEKTEGGRAGGSGGSTGGGVSGDAATAEEPNKEGDKDKGKPADFKKDEDVEDQIKDIKKALEKIDTLLEENPLLEKIDEQIIDETQSIEQIAALQTNVIKLNSRVKKITKQVTGLQKKVAQLDQKSQDYYKKSLQETVKENKKALEKFETMLKGIQYDKKTSKLSYESNKSKKISLNLQWAFFGDDSQVRQRVTDQKVIELQSKIPTSVNLSDVQSNIKNLFDAVERFPQKAAEE